MRPRAFTATGNASPVARHLANMTKAELWSLIGNRRPPRTRKGIGPCFVSYEKECYGANLLMQLLGPLDIDVPKAGAKWFFPVDDASRRFAAVFVVGGCGNGAYSRPDFAGERQELAGSAFPAGRSLTRAGTGAQVSCGGGQGTIRCRENGFRRFSIPELAAVMERATLWLGNDSWPMHLATAVGCPTFLP